MSTNKRVRKEQRVTSALERALTRPLTIQVFQFLLPRDMARAMGVKILRRAVTGTAAGVAGAVDVQRLPIKRIELDAWHTRQWSQGDATRRASMLRMLTLFHLDAVELEVTHYDWLAHGQLLSTTLGVPSFSKLHTLQANFWNVPVRAYVF